MPQIHEQHALAALALLDEARELAGDVGEALTLGLDHQLGGGDKLRRNTLDRRQTAGHGQLLRCISRCRLATISTSRRQTSLRNDFSFSISSSLGPFTSGGLAG